MLGSNLAGKLATVAQSGALLAAIAAPWALPPALGVAATAAVVAGVVYWRRELRRVRGGSVAAVNAGGQRRRVWSMSIVPRQARGWV